MEIEKKFLLREMPEYLESREKRELEQGYLCVRPTVRIRKSDEAYILTYKGKQGTKDIALDAQVSQELEMPLTEEAYLHMRKKVDGYLIAKTRYLIPLPDGHIGELDVFHGRLEGLRLIEVEFGSPEDARNFQPPSWFGENVSKDERYTNSHLAFCEDLSVFGASGNDCISI
ncbi:MAG: CYTH domain-containing protein [Lachnospiraceae bacterium]|nr:CYTH domain-containing protein [Lachnospiraceae bacterium]